MHLRVALAICLFGLLAASLAQEADHGEQTDAILEGQQWNVREQVLSRRKRGGYALASYGNYSKGEHTFRWI